MSSTRARLRPVGVRWAGDHGVLLEFGSLEHAMSACAQLRTSPVSGQTDVIAGARTALVRLRGHRDALEAHRLLACAEFTDEFAGDSAPEGEHITLDVAYDGADLAELAHELGMSAEAVIEWHSGQTWLAAFGGVPGFAYLVPRTRPLRVPRRATPRTAVPPGSVAVAGEFSGVYPRRMPGGWQVIGRTDAALWDLGRERPALVQPWDAVTYRPVRPRSVATGREGGTDAGTAASSGSGRAAVAVPAAHPGTPALHVLAPGVQTLIEDFGREGRAELGAGLSGVMDRTAARWANHLVGNHSEAPVLETLFGGLRLRALETVVLAVAGADADVTVSGENTRTRTVAAGAFPVRSGEVVAVGRPRRGARSVLAMRGGVAAPEVLGSVSTDTHTGIGPPPLASGDTVHAGHAATTAVQTPARYVPEPPSAVPPTAGTVTLRFIRGPRDDWFPGVEVGRLASQRWVVTPASDRIGIRLRPHPNEEGARPLERGHTGELLSEGMALGSIQVPASGEPVLLVNDQAITGGYPIIGVVVSADLPLAAQLTPDDTVRFAPVDPETLEPERQPGQDRSAADTEGHRQ